MNSYTAKCLKRTITKEYLFKMVFVVVLLLLSNKQEFIYFSSRLFKIKTNYIKIQDLLFFLFLKKKKNLLFQLTLEEKF